MKELYIIACISQDRGLGKAGDLLWHIPEDMQFFRTTTLDSTVVMGRKTYESIGRPLPKRQNIVLSRQDVDGVTTYRDQSALDVFLKSVPGKKFIIGGASLYQMYLDQAEKLYLTEVASTKPADTYFPEFNRDNYTRKVLQSGEHEGVKYQIAEYTRKSPLNDLS